MRVNSISYQYSIKTTSDRTLSSKAVQNELRLNHFVSFGAKNASADTSAQKLSAQEIKKRKNHLKYLGLEAKDYNKIALYDDTRYKRVLELLDNECEVECLSTISAYSEKRYQMALSLAKHNIVDGNLLTLSKLDEKGYNRSIELSDANVEAQYIELFTQLNDEQYEASKKLMYSGFAPVDAAYLAELTEEEQEKAIKLIRAGVSSDLASKVIISGQKRLNKFQELMSQGFKPEEAYNYTLLKPKECSLAVSYANSGVNRDVADEFATLEKEQIIKANKMLEEGVEPEAILYAIEAEEAPDDHKEYFKYRQRGYSRTTSSVLALLENDEIKKLSKILKKNKELFQHFKDEYEILVLPIQGTKSNVAILTKSMRLKDGTIVKLIRTFDDEGNKTQTRVENYPDKTSSSLMSNGESYVYRSKYDKFGDISESTQYIQSGNSDGISGVIHTKASKILPGAFESVYYDINDFITSNDGNANDFELETSVRAKGIPMSQTYMDNDGNTVFEEKFSTFDSKVKRKYKERKDSEGNIIFSDYTYNIKDKKGNDLMDISRRFERKPDGTVENTINGIKYILTYDDANKTVTISDGTKTRQIEFKNRLAKYFADRQWNIIKNLPADNLIIMDDHIAHWYYGRDEDAMSEGNLNILVSGENISIISHELGHFKSYEEIPYNTDKQFKDLYNQEMSDCMAHLPYNELEYIIYFSPIADIKDALGKSEFFAETNLLLSTYGTNSNGLKTRPMLLSRYCPRSMARCAELLGKTSKKSIL